MINLKALSEEELYQFVQQRGLPAYRARQLIHWIYEKGARSIEDITELSLGLRKSLIREAYISNLQLLQRQCASDGTEKFLFQLEDKERIESVLIPDQQRLTLCVSSQVGCPLRCAFCLTGRLGFKRNLHAHEIVDQVISVQRLIGKRITNIVYMGMGEPLLNLEAVAESILRITKFIKISKRKITVSTAGIVPGIKKLPELAPQVKLAVSLNATTDELRCRLMPVNKKYPLEELLRACREFPLQPRHRITFEYVLLEGINDSEEDALRLTKLLQSIPSKVNLIVFNSFPGAEFRPSKMQQVLRFQEILLSRGLTAIIRKSKGGEILAACGQLKADYEI